MEKAAQNHDTWVQGFPRQLGGIPAIDIHAVGSILGVGRLGFGLKLPVALGQTFLVRVAAERCA